MSDLFIFWCEACGKKLFMTDKKSLLAVKRPKLQKKLPFIDPENNKKTISVFDSEQKFYKCPNCGKFLKEVNQNDETRA